jgi:hypothetical protein
MLDLIAGRDLIAEAIQLNADAHFGRERYQLLAMNWLIEVPVSESDSVFDAAEVRPSLQRNALAAAGYGDAVQGLSGLIALGNAWESIDVYYALGLALDDDGATSLACLAKHRCLELVSSGRGSLHPANSTTSVFRQALSNVGSISTGEQGISRFYPVARKAADEWHAARLSFMLAKLNRGEHPDTHPEFWTGFDEPPCPGSLEQGTGQKPRLKSLRGLA